MPVFYSHAQGVSTMSRRHHRQSDFPYARWAHCFYGRRDLRTTVTILFASIKDLFICTRYVDNRLLVVIYKMLENRRLQHFLNSNFYQHCVELEHVTSKDAFEEFLGFDFQLDHHRLQHLLRPDLWKIREPNSAGPERHRTAAFHCARTHNVWLPST